jgi:Uma2 family endonuclease
MTVSLNPGSERGSDSETRCFAKIYVMGLIDPPDVLRRHQLTADEYCRMAELGLLAPDARVELIEGEIIDMASIGSHHASAVKRLNSMFTAALGASVIVAVQDSLRLGNRSQPQPDLTLLKPRADFYRDAHPTAEDVLLLIEVSDTTARYDRGIKLALYARHGVQEVWIVDLDNHMLRTYRNPVDGQYTEVMETASPSVLAPAALPQARIDLSAVLV